MEGRCPSSSTPPARTSTPSRAHPGANGPVAQWSCRRRPGLVDQPATRKAGRRCPTSGFSKDPRKALDRLHGRRDRRGLPLIGWVLMDNLTTATATTTPAAQADRERVHPAPGGRDALQHRVADADLLDELARSAPGEAVDLKARFAHALPAQVICDLFGVPAADRAELLRGGEVNLDTTLTPRSRRPTSNAGSSSCSTSWRTKRRNPADDLTTDLIVAQDRGFAAHDSERVGTLHLLLATAHRTGHEPDRERVLALLTHPGSSALLRSGARSWPDVIEETLRVQAPVAAPAFRFATEDLSSAA